MQDDAIREGKVNKWLQCDTNTKEQIRAQVESDRCFLVLLTSC
jgi:hypothetical protein